MGLMTTQWLRRGQHLQSLLMAAPLCWPFFGEISQINLTDRDEAALPNGFWLGARYITLLIRYVSLNFSGDWLAYLHFLHWANTQSLERPDVVINLRDWLTLK